MRKPNLQVFALLALFTLLLYLPILTNPSFLLERGNDLQEFFWPILYFVKTQILKNQALPLWNNLFFSGTPLLPDPQSPLFYPPNAIFLFLPIGIGFIVSFLLHTLLGGIGAYLAARLGFGFSKPASLFSAALFTLTPQIAGRLEAGHFGLVNSFAWLPFVVLAVVKLAKSPEYRWSLLLAVSLAGLFFTHVLIFTIAALATSAFWAGVLLIERKKNPNKSLVFFILAGLTAFGLVAITLLLQLEWKDQTTRILLLETRDVYPKWTSALEFFRATFWPWNIATVIDTEKWLALGLLPSLLALLGFWQANRRGKILLVVLTGTVLAIALNNLSPLYPLLLRQDWYVLLRVATRIWFIPILTIVFLAGFGFEKLLKTKSRNLAVLLALVAVVELLTLSWLRLSKPVPERELAPLEVYQFLQKDEERFRVYCTTRCLSQKEAAEAGLELVEGYGTLQQTNYYKHAWQLTGTYWNYYTLAIPPIGSYKFGEPQPDAKSLGKYNLKYVISPYELTDERFILEEEIGGYLIYRNQAFLPRTYFMTKERNTGSEAAIVSYSPNNIRVDTSSMETQHLVLAEIYNPGWKAYLNGKEEVVVQQTPEALRFVDLTANTQFVDFRYQPESYKTGKTITLATLLLLAVVGLKKWRIKKKTPLG